MNVRIYPSIKNAMQSGRAGNWRGGNGYWLLEYETVSARRPENLMGWTSSKDTLNQVRLKFESREDAIDFAKSKGWDYTVQKAHVRKIRPRNYSDNFKYQPPEEV